MISGYRTVTACGFATLFFVIADVLLLSFVCHILYTDNFGNMHRTTLPFIINLYSTNETPTLTPKLSRFNAFSMFLVIGCICGFIILETKQQCDNSVVIYVVLGICLVIGFYWFYGSHQESTKKLAQNVLRITFGLQYLTRHIFGMMSTCIFFFCCN